MEKCELVHAHKLVEQDVQHVRRESERVKWRRQRISWGRESKQTTVTTQQSECVSGNKGALIVCTSNTLHARWCHYFFALASKFIHTHEGWKRKERKKSCLLMSSLYVHMHATRSHSTHTHTRLFHLIMSFFVLINFTLTTFTCSGFFVIFLQASELSQMARVAIEIHTWDVWYANDVVVNERWWRNKKKWFNWVVHSYEVAHRWWMHHIQQNEQTQRQVTMKVHTNANDLWKYKEKKWKERHEQDQCYFLLFLLFFLQRSRNKINWSSVWTLEFNFTQLLIGVLMIDRREWEREKSESESERQEATRGGKRKVSKSLKSMNKDEDEAVCYSCLASGHPQECPVATQ